MGRLETENQNLRKEKEALYSPEKVEELAREKLGYTKPHEFAIKVIKNNSSEISNEEGKPPHSSKRLWDKMKEEAPLKWLLR